MSFSPRNATICPASARSTVRRAPRSKSSTAVGRAWYDGPSAGCTSTYARADNDPAKIRADATFCPADARSTLNTLACKASDATLPAATRTGCR